MERYEFIKQFHPLDQSDYELLTKNLHSKKFKKGENLVVPGQVQSELFIIQSGVQMVYFDADKKPVVIAFTYCPNFIVIPESLSFQKPSKYYVTCITDSEVDYLRFEDLQNLFNKSPAIERLFRKMTEAVLAGLLNRYVEFRCASMEENSKHSVAEVRTCCK